MNLTTIPTKDSSNNVVYKPNITLSTVEPIVIESDTIFKNVISYNDFYDKIEGDYEYFKITKEFKYSINNVVFSEWLPLTDIELNKISKQPDTYFKFRYITEPFQDDYNIRYDITRNNNIEGWFEAENIKIEKDYPLNGEISYNLGYGTNGQYHIDTTTNKIYIKQLGYWTGGIKYTKTVTNTYIPVKFNNELLSDIFIESITSKHPFIPINDFNLELGNDIRFDKTDSHKIPSINDAIYINPLFQGIELTGYEELNITYIYSDVLTPSVTLKEFGFQYTEHLDSTDSIFCLVNVGDQITYKPPFVLKMFSIDSLSLSVDNQTCSTSWNPCLDVKFRYSFNSRNWESGWISLSLENLKCIKPNPLKFFYIEFLFTKICDNNGQPICVNDLIINGNIQNVTNNYKKLNRFGIRSDCTYINESDKNEIPSVWVTDTNICKPAPTFNPYDLTKPTQLLEKLSNDVSDIFGWTVDYYRVVPNDSGIDYVLHEYGTMDTVDKQPLKILVPDNKFPEDQVSFGSFDMSLFDNFEIHITKQEFYSKFGLGNRPAKEDYLFICQLNKYFKVDHAQSFRDFNNSAIFFKVTLVKKLDEKDISSDSTYSTDFSEMIKSSTLDSLIGHEVGSEVAKIANTDDLQNLTELTSIDTQFKYDKSVNVPISEVLDYKKPDPIMLKVRVSSIDYELENSTTIISKNYYDLMSNSITKGVPAITYGSVDIDDCTCCNRSISLWFNLYKYESGMIYNLIDNSTNYKIDFIDGNLIIHYYGQTFTIDVHISPKIWYGLIVNFNHKQNEIELFIYKRKSEHSCVNTDLVLVDSYQDKIVSTTTNNDKSILAINSSYLYLTNLRIWSENIPDTQHMFVLNQNVVRNTEHIVLSDNANKQVYSKHHKF